MRILGISEGSHDACWALIENGRILEAHHQERHSRIKNDKWLNPKLLPDADIVVGHQILDKVNERRKWSGQFPPIKRNISVDREYNHHETHAWAGWATSPFDDCDILTMDAVGEWDTATVHKVRDGVWTKTWGMQYPKSFGMPYSHVTNMCGYKEMQDEYIIMAMAALGGRYNRDDPKLFKVIDSVPKLAPMFQGSAHFRHYLFQPRYENQHIQVRTKQDKRDLARNVQEHYEYYLVKTVQRHTSHDNLILMGGCALNCVANSKIASMKKKIWIMPNPGDGGSALGAAARHYGKKLKWQDPYLGTEVPVMDAYKIVVELHKKGVAAVCSGRTEFGPRALGNRSLLADPRGGASELIMNDLKHKGESWRPFAPAILAEEYDNYFRGPASKYMQFTAQHKTGQLPLVTYVDNSARVQIVNKSCNSVLRKVLEIWFKQTGCPVLLNTSLNFKGEPMVNNLNQYRDYIKRSGLSDLS